MPRGPNLITSGDSVDRFGHFDEDQIMLAQTLIHAGTTSECRVAGLGPSAHARRVQGTWSRHDEHSRVDAPHARDAIFTRLTQGIDEQVSRVQRPAEWLVPVPKAGAERRDCPWSRRPSCSAR